MPALLGGEIEHPDFAVLRLRRKIVLRGRIAVEAVQAIGASGDEQPFVRRSAPTAYE